MKTLLINGLCVLLLSVVLFYAFAPPLRCPREANFYAASAVLVATAVVAVVSSQARSRRVTAGTSK